MAAVEEFEQVENLSKTMFAPPSPQVNKTLWPPPLTWLSKTSLSFVCIWTTSVPPRLTRLISLPAGVRQRLAWWGLWWMETGWARTAPAMTASESHSPRNWVRTRSPISGRE